MAFSQLSILPTAGSKAKNDRLTHPAKITTAIQKTYKEGALVKLTSTGEYDYLTSTDTITAVNGVLGSARKKALEDGLADIAYFGTIYFDTSSISTILTIGANVNANVMELDIAGRTSNDQSVTLGIIRLK
jgi:hypothetical protein